MKRLLRVIRAIVSLALRFTFAVIRSGWQTLWMILFPPRGLNPGFVEYTGEPLGRGGTTLLACLICLTPGATAVEIDPEKGWIRLHLLDLNSRDDALREIRECFEPLICVIPRRGVEP